MLTSDALRDDVPLHGPQVMRLIGRAIARHELDLHGLSVLTEAGVGLRSLAPVIAALAGAEVYAVGRDTVVEARADAERETLRLSALALVSDRVHVISTRLHAPLDRIDIVTDSPGVRPIDEAVLRALNENACVVLFHGAKDCRSRDVDVAACRRLRVAIAGVDEEAFSLQRYVPVAAIRGLLELGVELVGATVVVAGDGSVCAHAVRGLARAGVRVLAAWPETSARTALLDAEKIGDHLSDASVSASLTLADGLVLCPHDPDVRTVGTAAWIDATALAVQAPHIAVVSLGGEIDRRALAGRALRFWPAGGRGAAEDFLPLPRIERCVAGLKVGEVITRARRRGSSPLAAEQSAAAIAGAELLPQDLSVLRR
ncbi:MAG: hypothetical protein R2826_06710 [Thermoleophilia bacterium]